MIRPLHHATRMMPIMPPVSCAQDVQWKRQSPGFVGRTTNARRDALLVVSHTVSARWHRAGRSATRAPLRRSRGWLHRVGKRLRVPGARRLKVRAELHVSSGCGMPRRPLAPGPSISRLIAQKVCPTMLDCRVESYDPPPAHDRSAPAPAMLEAECEGDRLRVGEGRSSGSPAVRALWR